jgi:hypothetical protein
MPITSPLPPNIAKNLLTAKMKEALLSSLYRGLDSGAQKYQVGSRSLERYSLKEMQDMLDYLDRLDRPIGADGRMGQMFARRIMPTDW